MRKEFPAAYGEIKQQENGDYYTTRAQRTGCSMCGFGIHLEERPHRFDRLREDNPLEWKYWMYRCAKNKQTGEQYGWEKCLIILVSAGKTFRQCSWSYRWIRCNKKI